MALQAIGLLETKGLACLVTGVDAMLKAANVELAGPMRMVGSGLCNAPLALPMVLGITFLAANRRKKR